MNIIEIAKEVYANKYKRNESWTDISEIFPDLNAYNIQSEEIGLESFFIGSWCCTDTWVGWEVVFFKGEPFLMMFKSARKNYYENEVLNLEVYKEAYKEVSMKILEESLKNVSLSIMSDEELKKERTGFQVGYASQLLNKTVHLKETKEKVEVVWKWDGGYNSPSSEWGNIKVKKEDGTVIDLTVKDIYVPYGEID